MVVGLRRRKWPNKGLDPGHQLQGCNLRVFSQAEGTGERGKACQSLVCHAPECQPWPESLQKGRALRRLKSLESPGKLLNNMAGLFHTLDPFQSLRLYTAVYSGILSVSILEYYSLCNCEEIAQVVSLLKERGPKSVITIPFRTVAERL